MTIRAPNDTMNITIFNTVPKNQSMFLTSLKVVLDNYILFIK